LSTENQSLHSLRTRWPGRHPSFQYLTHYIIDAVIPIPVRDFASDPHLIGIGSFDINKCDAEVDEIKCGLASGSILTGILWLVQEVEIRPGIVIKTLRAGTTANPFSARSSLHIPRKITYSRRVGWYGPKIDPMLCRADRPVGQV
jgi:translation initiation factor 2 subunit 3